MKAKSIFITSPDCFEGTSLRNPITTLDHTLKLHFPDYYSVNYDTKLLADKEATATEKQLPFYNDYRERFGSSDISVLDAAITEGRSIFLNGFNQEQFLYIAPKLRETAEIIYFFKCPKIYDLSALSQFPNLKCVHIYWNNSLERLWDMSGNKALQVLSFVTITKLRNVAALKESYVEYVHLDSSDNSGHAKKSLFDPSVFQDIPHLKHLSLVYSDLKVDQ